MELSEQEKTDLRNSVGHMIDFLARSRMVQLDDEELVSINNQIIRLGNLQDKLA